MRISSPFTPVIKFALPALLLTLLATVTGLTMIHGLNGPVIPLLFVFTPLITLFTLMFSPAMFRLADEVHDNGTHLEVRRGDSRLTIELSQVTKVSYSPTDSLRAVSLRLVSNTIFGRELSFIPRDAPLGFSIPASVVSLRERVENSKPDRDA